MFTKSSSKIRKFYLEIIYFVFIYIYKTSNLLWWTICKDSKEYMSNILYELLKLKFSTNSFNNKKSNCSCKMQIKMGNGSHIIKLSIRSFRQDVKSIKSM